MQEDIQAHDDDGGGGGGSNRNSGVYQFAQKEIKFVFIDNTIIYRENPTEPTTKLSELMSSATFLDKTYTKFNCISIYLK